MGVKGLLRFAERNTTKERVILRKGSLLCLDFVAYSRFAWKSSGSNRFEDLDRFVREQVVRARRAGIELAAFVDGPVSTPSRRAQTIQRRTEALVQSQHALSSGYPDLSPPFGAELACRNALVESGARVVDCEFEADPCLAEFAKRHDTPVVSQDSDFLVYDCPGLVLFEDVDIEDDQVILRVLRPSRILAALKFDSVKELRFVSALIEGKYADTIPAAVKLVNKRAFPVQFDKEEAQLKYSQVEEFSTTMPPLNWCDTVLKGLKLHGAFWWPRDGLAIAGAVDLGRQLIWPLLEKIYKKHGIVQVTEFTPLVEEGRYLSRQVVPDREISVANTWPEKPDVSDPLCIVLQAIESVKDSGIKSWELRALCTSVSQKLMEEDSQPLPIDDFARATSMLTLIHLCGALLPLLYEDIPSIDWKTRSPAHLLASYESAYHQQTYL